MSIATDLPADSLLQTRRVWLAPICLCLVAGLHVYRVSTAGQTPWKGGSFGMFSTIDSEHSRFVHAYLMTKNGSLPLQIPNELDKKVAELRAAPQLALAQEIADRLAERSWIDRQALDLAIAKQLRQHPPRVPLSGEQLQALREHRLPTDDLRRGNLLTAAQPDSISNAIAAQGVRVEVWKLEMPAGTTELRPRLLLTASKIATEKQP